MVFLFVLPHSICLKKLTDIYMFLINLRNINTTIYYYFLLHDYKIWFYLTAVLFESVVIGRRQKLMQTLLKSKNLSLHDEWSFHFRFWDRDAVCYNIGCMLRIVMHCDLHQQASQSMQDLNLTHNLAGSFRILVTLNLQIHLSSEDSWFNGWCIYKP